MNSKKLIALLLSVLMIFSQVQGVFAIDFNQPAFNAEERIEIEGVEKDGELIFDLGPAIEEAERLEESNFNGSNGLEIGDEIISGPVRGTGEEITVQYKITAKMTGLNGGEFDWSVFEDENFVADLSFKNNSNKTIKSTPIAFNKENVAEGVNYTLKTDEVTTSDQMSPSIKINKIDNNLDIRAYYIKPSNPTQAEGVYKIEFEVIQIINPKVTIEWQNADGSPMIDANRPADTDLVNIASVGGIVNELKFNLMAKDGVYNLLRPYKKGNETVRPLVRDRQIRTKLNQVADESKVTAELNGKADGKVTINGKVYAVTTSYSKEEGFKYIFTYPAEGICLTKDALQKQFEAAANPMFDRVGSKKGVYIGHFDKAKKEVTVYIIDKTQGAKNISGTGLIAGLTELYKNNYLTKIQVGSEVEKDLKALAEAAPDSGMTVEQMFKFAIGADILNAVQAQGNTGKLADFIDKNVVLKLTIEQPGCGNAVIVEYKVSGKEAAASLLKDKLDPQDISVWVGDGINWKDGVKLKEGTVDTDGKLQALLDKATVTDESDRNSNKVGNYPGTLKLAFEDGSELKVDKQNLIVKEKILPSTDNNAPKDAIEVKFLLGEGVKVVKDGVTTEGDKANPKLYATYKIKPGTDLEIYQHSQLRDTIFGLIGAEPNEGYTKPVTWKGNIVNNPNNYVVSKDNNVFTASATKTPAVCKTKDALKAEFEAAANDKFASVSSKPGIYSAVYDATTHKVTVTILDKTQEFKKLKGTGLVAGLFDLKEHNNVVAVQIGAQDRINLPDELTMNEFALLVSAGIGTELNIQGVPNLQTLGDFAGKTVAVKLYIKEDGCDNEVSVTYYITGQLNDSDKDVIPYEPNDPENPTNPQDPKIPKKDNDNKDVNAEDFVRVAFKVDPNPSGTLTLDNIVEKPVISALVRITKPQKKWADFTMPTTNDTVTYKFLKWEMPTNTVVADGDVAVAKFIKNGDKIDPEDTVPEGVHKVTLKQGMGVEDNEKYATYAVFDGKTLKEAGIVFDPVANVGFDNPAWYDGQTKVENLAKVTVKEDKTFEAKANALQCLTKEGLKAQFEAAANPMFAGVAQRKDAYIGKFDETTHTVTVTIINKDAKLTEMSGSGLIAGLTKLYKENKLTKIKISENDAIDLNAVWEYAKSVLPAADKNNEEKIKASFMGNLKVLIGGHVGNTLKNGEALDLNTDKLGLFINKEVKLDLTIEQPGCNNATNIVYTVKGVEKAPTDGKLTIKKVLENTPVKMMRAPGANAEQIKFKFTVTKPDGTSEEFELAANGSKTLDNLAYGEYTIKETDSKGYTPFFAKGNEEAKQAQEFKITISSSDEVKVTVTNKNIINQNNLTVRATKIWDGGPESDHTAVTLTLKRTSAKANSTEETVADAYKVETINGNNSDTITYVWKNLPKHDGEGYAYTYRVEELGTVSDPTSTDKIYKVGNNEYVSKVEDDTDNTGNETIAFKITNTYKVPKTEKDIVATKKWVGVPEGTATPTVKFQLQRTANGVTEDVANQLKEVTGSPNAQGLIEVNFGKQDKTDANGNEYVYSVKELDANGNAFNDEKYTSVVDGLTVTNTYKTTPAPTEFKIEYNSVNTEYGTVDPAYETVKTDINAENEAGKIKGSTATAKPGCKFVKWIDATGKQVSTDAKFVPTERKAATYKAVFEKEEVTPEPTDFTIKYISADKDKGTVSPAEETVAIKGGEIKGSTATAKDGYKFVKWMDINGNTKSTKAKFVPTERKAATYRAVFEKDETKPDIVPEKSREPIIDPIYDSDDVVTGRGIPGSTIEVQFPDGTVERVPVDRDGRWIVPIPYPLYEDDIVRARQLEFGKEPSDWVSQRVRYDDEYWRERDRRDRRDREDKKEDTKKPVEPKNVWTPPALNARDHFSYIKGYGNNMFAPNRTITRAEVAMIFARLSINQSTVGAPQFKDVKAGDWYKTAVDIMARQGVIKGYEDGTFRPNQPITRREFAAIAARYAGNIDAWKTFRDVPPTDWAYTLINRVAGAGWINGYEDGTFRPNNNITRAEVVAIVNRMLNRKADKKYVDNNLMRAKDAFVDNMRSAWYFYDIYEAAIGHSYERQPNGVDEKWNRVNGQAFEIRER